MRVARPVVPGGKIDSLDGRLHIAIIFKDADLLGRRYSLVDRPVDLGCRLGDGGNRGMISLNWGLSGKVIS